MTRKCHVRFGGGPTEKAGQPDLAGGLPYDERDPAVMGAIHDIIAACKKLGLTCSICGQAPSVYPELAERLVEWGIDSISVNPDAIDRTRRILAAAEQRVLLDELRGRRSLPTGDSR